MLTVSQYHLTLLSFIEHLSSTEEKDDENDDENYIGKKIK